MSVITVEEYTRFQKEQKALKEAFQVSHSFFKMVTTRKPHLCEKCHQIIPKEAQAYTRVAMVTNTRSWRAHFQTLHYCIECSPKEAP